MEDPLTWGDRTAATYREMGWGLWLNQAETALAEFQVSHGPGRTNE
jgi:hypothetical protein